jgi:polar amino acid transport system substrate-binding protein
MAFLKTLSSFLIATGFSIASFAASNPLCPKPLKVGWEPYSPFKIEDNKAPVGVRGIDIEFAKVILKKAGCDVQFVAESWRRQLIELERGNIDIITSANKTKKREEFALFLNPYIKASNVMFALKKNTAKLNFKDLKDIKSVPNFKLGAVEGYEYGDLYAELLKDQKFKILVEQSSSNENLINKTERNHLDAFLGDYIAISYILKNINKTDLFQSLNTKVDEDSLLYFGFSKKSVSPELAKTFDNSMKALMKDGSFYKILNQYIGKQEATNLMLK